MRETGRRRSELAEMIVQREEEFIARWMERFQARLGPGVAPPTDVLDSVPRFLDDIVRQLTEPLDARGAPAGVDEPGAQRLEQTPAARARGDSGARLHRGLAAGPIGPLQPRGQRHQVQPRGLDHRPAGTPNGRRDRDRRGGPVRRSRRGDDLEDLRPLRPGGERSQRPRPRANHRPPGDGGPRRHHRRPQPSRPGMRDGRHLPDPALARASPTLRMRRSSSPPPPDRRGIGPRAPG